MSHFSKIYIHSATYQIVEVEKIRLVYSYYLCHFYTFTQFLCLWFFTECRILEKIMFVFYHFEWLMCFHFLGWVLD